MGHSRVNPSVHSTELDFILPFLVSPTGGNFFLAEGTKKDG
jgi:hypothetical protein